MSDLQDLIHKTSIDCLERGKIVERERIIKLLEDAANFHECDWGCDNYGCSQIIYSDIIALIKGEK